MQTILIVDNDLGFVFWLGDALCQGGYEVFPAKAVADALTLISEFLSALDLLIINFSLPDAPKFVKALRRGRERVKVIALTREAEPSPEYYPLLEAVLHADKINGVSRAEYLQLVHDVLMSPGARA